MTVFHNRGYEPDVHDYLTFAEQNTFRSFTWGDVTLEAIAIEGRIETRAKIVVTEKNEAGQHQAGPTVHTIASTDHPAVDGTIILIALALVSGTLVENVETVHHVLAGDIEFWDALDSYKFTIKPEFYDIPVLTKETGLGITAEEWDNLHDKIMLHSEVSLYIRPESYYASVADTLFQILLRNAQRAEREVMEAYGGVELKDVLDLPQVCHPYSYRRLYGHSDSDVCNQGTESAAR